MRASQRPPAVLPRPEPLGRARPGRWLDSADEHLGKPRGCGPTAADGPPAAAGCRHVFSARSVCRRNGVKSAAARRPVFIPRRGGLFSFPSPEIAPAAPAPFIDGGDAAAEWRSAKLTANEPAGRLPPSRDKRSALRCCQGQRSLVSAARPGLRSDGWLFARLAPSTAAGHRPGLLAEVAVPTNAADDGRQRPVRQSACEVGRAVEHGARLRGGTAYPPFRGR